MSISQYPAASGGAGTSLAGNLLGVSASYSTGSAVVNSSGGKQKIAKKILRADGNYSSNHMLDVAQPTPLSPYYFKSGTTFYPIGNFDEEVLTPSYGGEIVQYPNSSFVFLVNHGRRDTAISNLNNDYKFVAVGDNGRWSTSPDGITWTDRGYMPAANYGSLYKIKFANGIFVASGDYGLIVTSSDGQNWTARTSGVGTNLYNEIHFENGTFFMVTNNGILSSTDGITWTLGSVSGLNSYVGYSDFSYGNGAYVLTDRPGNKVWKSTDGVNWTNISSSFSGLSSPNSVAYGNGIFVVTDDNQKLWVSADGDSWSLSSESNFSRVNVAVRAMQFLGGRFIGLNPLNGMTYVIHSEDGITWKKLGKYVNNVYKYLMEHEGTFYLRETNVLYITTDISKVADNFVVATYESKVEV